MRIANLAFPLLAVALTAQSGLWSQGCPWAGVRTPGTAGPANDPSAGYATQLIPATPGLKVRIRAEFPHVRYLSWTLYDGNWTLVSALADRDITPSKGRNPFVPGTPRDGNSLGAYELTVMVGPQPANPASNTLYIDPAKVPGDTFPLIYRIYLVDRARTAGSKDTLGGLALPEVQFYRPDGQPYCPDAAAARETLARIWSRSVPRPAPASLERARGEAANPPLWWHSGKDTVSLFKGANEGAVYLGSRISSAHGPFLVFRWKAPRTPVETFDGKPFPAEEEMRFWSLVFNSPEGTGERSLQDVEVPVLPNGYRQLVVGFNGVGRPEFVPERQWVGLKLAEARLTLRYMQAAIGYRGNLSRLPAGEVPAELRDIVPGGTYCNAGQLRELLGRR